MLENFNPIDYFSLIIIGLFALGFLVISLVYMIKGKSKGLPIVYLGLMIVFFGLMLEMIKSRSTVGATGTINYLPEFVCWGIMAAGYLIIFFGSRKYRRQKDRS